MVSRVIEEKEEISIYIGDKYVIVEERTEIIREHYPVFFQDVRGLVASSSLIRDATAEQGTGVKAPRFSTATFRVGKAGRAWQGE